MKVLTKPKGYWTKKRCYEEALKYVTKKDFLNNSASAFRIAQRNNWLDHVCNHMVEFRKRNGYYTFEICQREALKYTKRLEFYKSDPATYAASQRYDWLDEVCLHMEYSTLPRNYWTKEKCQTDALKYETRGDFCRASASAYAAALLNEWLDEICSHMLTVDHGWLHCIYGIVNKRLNKAYIGLTRQAFEIRMNQHKSDKNTTNSSIISSHSDTEFIQLTSYCYSVNDVGGQERKYVETYYRKGFEVLNVGRLIGRLGPIRSKKPWTRETCQEEALKYKNVPDFRQNSNSAYLVARKQGWLEEITAHLDDRRVSRTIWTKELCAKEAKKYSTRSAFGNNSKGAYSASLKYKWLDAICSHMKKRKPSYKRGYWTKIKCADAAQLYNSTSDFRKYSPSAYLAAKKNGWFSEICSHIKITKYPSGYWTKELCRLEALKFKSKQQFKAESGKAHAAAKRYKWTDDICQHMVPSIMPVGYWTKDLCVREALKYQTKEDFKRGSGGAYMWVTRNKYLTEVCQHMIFNRVPRGHWNNRDHCAIEAKKYNIRNQFKVDSRGAYASSKKNGWLDEICKHMKVSKYTNKSLL